MDSGAMECDHDSEIDLDELRCTESLTPNSQQFPNRPNPKRQPLREARAVPINQTTISNADALFGSFLQQGQISYFSTERQRDISYKVAERLGQGAFGTVYKCRDTTSNEPVAIKYISINDAVDGCPQSALREIALLRRCSSKHPNIISLLDVYYSSQTGRRCDIFLVLEYCEMDLKVFIRKNGIPDASSKTGKGGLQPSLVKNFLHQILCGLDFLHMIAVAHRDLKPQNILVKNGVLKIADFGLGKIMSEHALVSLEVVTLYYRPPEVLLNVSYSLAVDIWSAGCIFAEMCNNLVLLKGDCEMNQLKVIFRTFGLPTLEDWPTSCGMDMDTFEGNPEASLAYLDRFSVFVGEAGVDLLKKMLVFHPSKRCTTRSALNHPFFDGFAPSITYEDCPLEPLRNTRFSELGSRRVRE